MNDPWIQTTVWGLTVGVDGGMSRGGQRGKNWDNCNRITFFKNPKKKKKNPKTYLSNISTSFPMYKYKVMGFL